MAFNIKKSLSEAYNKGVIKARELQEEDTRKKGLKVSIVVEREDGKRLLIETHGVKGRVQVDDYDEEKISKFLGHPLGAIRSALKSGKRYVDNKDRITFDFSAPVKTTKPFKPIVIKLPKAPKMKRAPVNRLTTPKVQKQGYYSATLGRWVN
jgi:hypothetical protein